MVRVRATKGYVAGVGTTSALIGAIGCAFAVLSAVVAVHGWPLTLQAPDASTVEDRGTGGGALPSLGLFPAAQRTRADGRAAAEPGRRARGIVVRAGAGPVAGAFGPSADRRVPATHAPASGPAPAGAPAAGAAGSPAQPSPSPGAGSGSAGSETTATPPPPAADGSSPTLGGTVTQVMSGAGTAVSQTGQQLGGAVQGATSQLGDVVGQVSPAVGQAVTQAGQTVGGVVGGTTGTVGQVVTGTGTTVGRLLGGLAVGR